MENKEIKKNTLIELEDEQLNAVAGGVTEFSMAEVTVNGDSDLVDMEDTIAAERFPVGAIMEC